MLSKGVSHQKELNLMLVNCSLQVPEAISSVRTMPLALFLNGKQLPRAMPRIYGFTVENTISQRFVLSSLVFSP